MKLLLISICFLYSVYFVSTSKIRTYYIAAVEVEWDFMPTGENQVHHTISNFNEKNSSDTDRIGSIYTKIIYKRFSNASFITEIPNPKWMGLLGPVIRAEVGDTVVVHFKNLASGANLSMHPHGLLYDKHTEGALYLDKTSASFKTDDGVPPGGAYKYIWNLTDNFAPTRDDDNCIAFSYHSHTNPEPDINTGLVGMLLSCRRGILSDDGEHRTDGYRDLFLYAEIMLEFNSWKISDNINKCGAPSICQKLLDDDDPAFTFSNRMRAFNGLMFGNLNFDVTEGEKIAWHFMGLSTGFHSISIYGQTFITLGKRTDTISIYPATFVTTSLIPINVGKWLMFSRNPEDFREGMSAFLTVHPGKPQTTTKSNPTYTYYLAAEEVEWNYGPSGVDGLTGESLLSPASHSGLYFRKGPNFIGGIYKKARYFEYTDASFSQKKNRTNTDVHLGLLGPVIRAEVGETIKVVFMNFASRPYSFMPFGVSLEKSNEGALYQNDPGITGKIAQPGENVTYIFTVPFEVSPTTDDPQCLTYMYQSAVDYVKDVNSGLIGPLLVCKISRIDNDRKQRFVDKEFHLLFHWFDENESWYLDDNIKTYITGAANISIDDPAFFVSNLFSAINGLAFANIEGLEMCVGETVSWHVSGYDKSKGLHGIYFDGNTLQIDHTNKDSKVVIGGTSFTGVMIPDNVGSWEVICRTNNHFTAGMTGLYRVKNCTNMPQSSSFTQQGATRTYYISAEEIDWDYAPRKIDLLSGQNLDDPNSAGNIFVHSNNEFIGTVYRKVTYREYTDGTFTTQKQRPEQDAHLGLMGPFIKAEVGDTIQVFFKNKANRSYSINPQGVLYQNSDARYNSQKQGSAHDGSNVRPGEMHTYVWHVPARSGPAYNDPNCISWMYYSGVDSVKDFYSGLVGPLVICAKGYLSQNGKRNDVDHEFALLFSIFLENESWYLQENIQRFASSRKDINDPDFVESNTLHTINGYIYGNVPDLTMGVNQKIAWYILALGSDEDYHTAHFHGETFLQRSSRIHRGDVVEVFPSTSETVQMYTDNPGTWILHCHVGDHVVGGMEATYTVLANPGTRRGIAGTGSSVRLRDSSQLYKILAN